MIIPTFDFGPSLFDQKGDEYYKESYIYTIGHSKVSLLNKKEVDSFSSIFVMGNRLEKGRLCREDGHEILEYEFLPKYLDMRRHKSFMEIQSKELEAKNGKNISMIYPLRIVFKELIGIYYYTEEGHFYYDKRDSKFNLCLIRKKEL